MGMGCGTKRENTEGLSATKRKIRIKEKGNGQNVKKVKNKKWWRSRNERPQTKDHMAD